jgi:CRISPR-associated endonuclease/helicase Cas3
MFYARSASHGHDKEPISNHLHWVSALAKEFATSWSGGEEAAFAGSLHDVGKYGDLFQDVLNHNATHVDHWTAGAYLAVKCRKEQGLAAYLAIEGHHEGLQRASKDSLLHRYKLFKEEQLSHSGLQWSGKLEDLEKRWMEDGGKFGNTFKSTYAQNANYPVAAMLDARMLYSALVDADYLSSEAFEQSGMEMVYRKSGLVLQPEQNLRWLLEHVAGLAQTTKASADMLAMRSDLLAACLNAGERPQGAYALAAPTGSGKTIAMLAFALKHAQAHGLRRIIVVLPYLSIIDQTVKEYRKILNDSGTGYIIEDDSLARDVGIEENSVRQMAQNWDAPVIITTTIRFFESLFSNRPMDCRKLHRIANSIVLFDEAQTLPPLLAAPTIAALSHLIRGYACSVVFSTATQPAFESISDKAKQLCGAPWQPTAVAPNSLGLFQHIRRVEVCYMPVPQPWEGVAAQIRTEKQVLAIVNMKRHARALFGLVKGGEDNDAFHLTTSMCPQHRRDKLQNVRERMGKGLSCHLIATQCVEAGVDLDFPVLWRALAPLDSLCQAAGRCNRNGSIQLGRMTVFNPMQSGKERLYPDDTYQNAAQLVHEMAVTSGWPDIFDPAIIKEYYLKLYNLQQNIRDRAHTIEEMGTAIMTQDFPEVSKLYRWIQQYASSIVVPYQGAMELYNSLSEAADRGEVNKAWFTQARKITVGEAINREVASFGWLKPIKKGREVVDGWYILLPESGLYNDNIGLDMGDKTNFPSAL